MKLPLRFEYSSVASKLRMNTEVVLGVNLLVALLQRCAAPRRCLWQQLAGGSTPLNSPAPRLVGLGQRRVDSTGCSLPLGVSIYATILIAAYARITRARGRFDY